MNSGKKWNRLCPSCGALITLTTREGFRYAEKNKCLCRICANKKVHNMKGHVEGGRKSYTRKCIKCNKEVTTKYRQREDVMCRICSCKNKKGSPSHFKGITRKNTDRICKSCGVLFNNSTSLLKCRKCNLLEKHIYPVFCKKCGCFRLKTFSKSNATKLENNSSCITCFNNSRKGCIGNRRGCNMPISAKIILSQKLSGKNHPQFGKPLTDEHKDKIRKACAESFKNKFNISPNYNKKSCVFFDLLSKKTNTKIRHAENGGEFFIKSLGYWVDGYDSENNIVYEWYEKHHFKADESLKKDDVRRKEAIKEYLGCMFIGISEKTKKIIE